jgi:hypothetical protein
MSPIDSLLTAINNTVFSLSFSPPDVINIVQEKKQQVRPFSQPCTCHSLFDALRLDSASRFSLTEIDEFIIVREKKTMRTNPYLRPIDMALALAYFVSFAPEEQYVIVATGDTY